jgi:hypothetical protein
MRTLAHGLPSRPLGAHLAAADALSGGCCWSSSTRAFMVEVYTSVSAGRTVPGARRVRICVLFNVIVRYTRGTSRVQYGFTMVGGGSVQIRSMDHLVAYTFYARNLLSRMI